MPVILDTGILYAFYDRSDRWHGAAVELMASEAGGLLVPSPVVPEVDHLLGARLGRMARLQFYRGLVEAYYVLIELPQEKIIRVREIEERFAELDLGFVDCAVVALAEITGLKRIATADRRHFEALSRAYGLSLVPARDLTTSASP